ncbi:sirohydrochlorin chelatase [Terrilactibacillus sp. S3-3]|nr:sirohydrochlorin chelatase [Terrilactibacillus sp. S3-3]
MLGVLYVGHGSRMKEGVLQVNQFLDACMADTDVPIQHMCYLEIARPTIEEGIDRCVRDGANVILIQPVLLLSAGHAKRDIPTEIEKARRKYPGVRFLYGRPFGVDEWIVNILIERLHEQRRVLSPETAVLLVGRGSSDPNTKRDFSEICRLLQQKGIRRVSACYLAAAAPSFDEGLQQASENEQEDVFVIPYLLFTGVLMKTMKRKIGLQNAKGSSFVLCRPLGYHPALIRLLKKRMKEAFHESLSSHG